MNTEKEEEQKYTDAEALEEVSNSPQARASGYRSPSMASAIFGSLWTGAAYLGNYVSNSFWPSSVTERISFSEGFEAAKSSSEEHKDGVDKSTHKARVPRSGQLHHQNDHYQEPRKPLLPPAAAVVSSKSRQMERPALRLLGRETDNHSIERKLLELLHECIPTRLRLNHHTWRLLYGSPEHGFSLATLFDHCTTDQWLHHNHRQSGPVLTIVQDDGGICFGVFGTEAWRPHFGHYGTGECFLWRTKTPVGIDGDDDSDSTQMEVEVFRGTGKNDYYLISEADYVAAGCGDGKFGFLLDDDLLYGQSDPVPTFDNPTLASAPRFTCVSVEVWALEIESYD